MDARIVAVSFGLMAGGFSRVMEGILHHLADRYEVHQLVINHRGGGHLREAHGKAWQIHGNQVPGDPQGLRAMKRLTEEIRPQLVLTLHDLYYQLRYARCLEEFPQVVRVAYVPVDGELLGNLRPQALQGFDTLVAYTEFGRRQLNALAGDSARSSSHPEWPKVEVIPHGVDSALFRPLVDVEGGDRGAAKRLVFGEHLAGEDSFIVLNANRFAARKRIELTLAGFARFAEGKPSDVRLCLHMATESLGASLLGLAEKYGIGDRLLLTHRRRVHPDFDDERLNLLYNACDVGINTSEGEGWGLVSFEHAATGAAQIVPRHSACAELWEASAVLLEPRSGAPCHQLQVERRTVDPADVAHALEQLYQDREVRRRMAKAAYLNATQRCYRWDEIAAQWHRLFHQLLVAA